MRTPIRPLGNRGPVGLLLLVCSTAMAWGQLCTGSLTGMALDPAGAPVPAPYSEGNAPRILPNARIPGTNNLSASLFKQVPLSFRGGAKLEIRLETFNVLNRVQFAAPDTKAGDPTFGQITAQANQPRQVQVGLRLYS
jgi:hypothetical protein